MRIVDANVILRYILDDIEELSVKSAEIIEKNDIFIPNEIIAEVIYVLEKVYKVDRMKINNILRDLINYDNITTNDKDVLLAALEIYAARKLDFIDTLLISYKKLRKYTIFTFDKKLYKLLGQV